MLKRKLDTKEEDLNSKRSIEKTRNHYYIYEQTKEGRIEYYFTYDYEPPTEKLEELKTRYYNKKSFVLVESKTIISNSNEYFMGLIHKGIPVELDPLMYEMELYYPHSIEIFNGFQPLGFVPDVKSLEKFFEQNCPDTFVCTSATRVSREEYNKGKEDIQEFQGYNYYRRDDSMYGYFDGKIALIFDCK